MTTMKAIQMPSYGGAGVVAAVGAGVTNMAVGQEVYGIIDRSRSGAYAEYAIAKADAIAPKPKSSSKSFNYT
jgi:NADPH:quinone reductase-like Zn-dependent oxidoreductase